MSRDPALHELLEDLGHDLVKYLRLPLRMLPPDADLAAVRGALECALLRTRESRDATLGARELWAKARPALAALAGEGGSLAAFETALMRVLAWHEALSGRRTLDRAQLEADLLALAAALDRWLAEVRDG